MPRWRSLRSRPLRYFVMNKRQKTLAWAGAIVCALATVRADGNAQPKVISGPARSVLTVTTNELPATRTSQVQIRSGVLAPGASTAWHTHPSPPFVYVVSGTGTWEFKNEPTAQIRRAGEAIMEPANVTMRVVNRAAVPLSFVIFQVSKPGEPVIVPAR
jgi:quercetin dioxygenase-like cupin family protein